MTTKLTSFLLILSFLTSFGAFAGQKQAAQMRQASPDRKMVITGRIADVDNGYVIQGKAPPEVYTIINADPALLDEFVKTGKTVRITVRIVSGDNVEVVKIDGRGDGQKKK